MPRERVLLRLHEAAAEIGIHPLTLKRWSREGRAIPIWIGKERRFTKEECRRLTGRPSPAERREVLYCRVSGAQGQETSLAAQESELRGTATGEVVEVIFDKASGLSAKRRGIHKVLELAKKNQADVVRVTHADRLARFGVEWIREILAAYNVELEILHEKEEASPTDELLADFVSLVACFSGRMYGQRSAAARKRLLEQAKT